MRNLILLFILLVFTACQKAKEGKRDLGADFDFWVINGKVSRKSQTAYTVQAQKNDKNGTIGIIYSDANWAKEGDSLIQAADGSFMRWKVVTNPNHPDWGKGKEVENVQ